MASTESLLFLCFKRAKLLFILGYFIGVSFQMLEGFLVEPKSMKTFFLNYFE